MKLEHVGANRLQRVNGPSFLVHKKTKDKFAVIAGNEAEARKSSSESENEMETENTRIPSPKWHPVLETRRREVSRTRKRGKSVVNTTN